MDLPIFILTSNGATQEALRNSWLSYICIFSWLKVSINERAKKKKGKKTEDSKAARGDHLNFWHGQKGSN